MLWLLKGIYVVNSNRCVETIFPVDATATKILNECKDNRLGKANHAVSLANDFRFLDVESAY